MEGKAWVFTKSPLSSFEEQTGHICGSPGDPDSSLERCRGRFFHFWKKLENCPMRRLYPNHSNTTPRIIKINI
jgi:hypothetical protein